jgi:ribosome maturation factor RimP
MAAIEPALREAVARSVTAQGAQIVDLVLRGDPAHRVLEVFIDSETGVTVALCTDVSRAVASAVDARQMIPGSYRLEVSSPGIDRPLQYPWQYTKHIGRPFRVRYRTDAGREECTGTLSSVDADGIDLEHPKTKEHVRIMFASIEESKVVAPW